MIKKSSLIFVLLIVTIFAQDNIYSKYYEECKKIAQSMTLEQQIGQTLQADFEAITQKDKELTNPDEALSLFLGSLLISGNAAPTDNGNIAKVPGSL
jgi:hypothetical protein